MSRSMHGPVPRQLASVLANLPEKVRVTWADHQLYGTELPVHGWHRIQGEIHLLVTLPDGSRGYLPASVTADGVRQLRQLIEAFRARSRRRQRELALLQALAREPRRPVSRETLVQRAWGFDYEGLERTVDVHVAKLRRKIEADPTNPVYIVTVEGLGYKLAAEVE